MISAGRISSLSMDSSIGPEILNFSSWPNIFLRVCLGRDAADEAESEWMVPLLMEEERDRLMAWQLGVSL